MRKSQTILQEDHKFLKERYTVYQSIDKFLHDNLQNSTVTVLFVTIADRMAILQESATILLFVASARPRVTTAGFVDNEDSNVSDACMKMSTFHN
jgi:hypothetical protein